MPTFDLTDRIVGSIGLPAGTDSSSRPSRVRWDVSIGGLPFFAPAGGVYPEKMPYDRQFVPLSKQQQDQSTEAGEQSLDNGFWYRNQSTFTGGAGRTFMEGGEDPNNRTKFLNSEGVDVWTPGKVTLLPQLHSYTNAGTLGDVASILGPSGEDAFICNVGSGWGYVTEPTPDQPVFTALPVTVPAGTTHITTVGDKILYGHPLGISMGTISVGAAALWTQAAGTPPRMWWAKQRLVTAVDNTLYALGITGASAAITTGLKMWTHPLTTWVWTSVTEAPGAILAAGYSGSHSAIYRFTLNDDGTIIAITVGATVAELPLGEIVYSILVYLGGFIAIGTNRGVRIGQVDDTGHVTYGPLSVTTTSPVKALFGADRFIYAAATNAMPTSATSGLFKIDLGGLDVNGRAPWSNDLSHPTFTGEVASIATFGNSGRLVFSMVSTGVFWPYISVKQQTGFVQTSYVRYSTLEPKHFLYAKVRTPAVLGGALAVSVVEADGDRISVITIPQGASNIEDLTLNRNNIEEGEVQLGLRFDFTRGSVVTTATPELNGWQMKAIPASVRKRQVSMTLSCMDGETDSKGIKVGKTGTAFTRMRALEDIATTGRQVKFTDYRVNESMLVTVDMQFTSLTPSGRDANTKWGGFIKVVLREV